MSLSVIRIKMKHYLFLLIMFASLGLKAQGEQARNPVIFADVPDMSIVRVDKTYYMSSTTMHLSPGVPIMKSTDLVNWKLINYNLKKKRKKKMRSFLKNFSRKN